jgi:hypothetical protein
MASTPLDKAAAAFKKQEQQREGAKAMAEYQASLAAEERKTARLRELRLAREAEIADAEAAAPRSKARGARMRKSA